MAWVRLVFLFFAVRKGSIEMLFRGLNNMAGCAVGWAWRQQWVERKEIELPGGGERRKAPRGAILRRWSFSTLPVLPHSDGDFQAFIRTHRFSPAPFRAVSGAIFLELLQSFDSDLDFPHAGVEFSDDPREVHQ